MPAALPGQLRLQHTQERKATQCRCSTGLGLAQQCAGRPARAMPGRPVRRCKHPPMRAPGSSCSKRRMRSAACSGTLSGSWYSAATIFWKVRYSAARGMCAAREASSMWAGSAAVRLCVGRGVPPGRAAGSQPGQPRVARCTNGPEGVLNGGRPANIWNSTQPRAQRSAAQVTGWLLRIWGGQRGRLERKVCA